MTITASAAYLGDDDKGRSYTYTASVEWTTEPYQKGTDAIGVYVPDATLTPDTGTGRVRATATYYSSTGVVTSTENYSGNITVLSELEDGCSSGGSFTFPSTTYYTTGQPRIEYSDFSIYYTFKGHLQPTSVQKAFNVAASYAHQYTVIKLTPSFGWSAGSKTPDIAVQAEIDAKYNKYKAILEETIT